MWDFIKEERWPILLCLVFFVGVIMDNLTGCAGSEPILDAYKDNPPAASTSGPEVIERGDYMYDDDPWMDGAFDHEGNPIDITEYDEFYVDANGNYYSDPTNDPNFVYENDVRSRPGAGNWRPDRPLYLDTAEGTSAEQFSYRAMCYDYAHHMELLSTDAPFTPTYTKLMRQFNELSNQPTMLSVTVINVTYDANWTDAIAYLSNDQSAIVELFFPEPASIAAKDRITVFGELGQGAYLKLDVETQCPLITVYDFVHTEGSGLPIVRKELTEVIDMPALPAWLIEFWFDEASYYDADGNEYFITGQSINGHGFDLYHAALNANTGIMQMYIRFKDGEYPESDSFTVLHFEYGRMYTTPRYSDKSAARNLPDVYHIPFSYQSVAFY